MKFSKKFKPNNTEKCGKSLLNSIKSGRAIKSTVRQEPVDFGTEALHANAYFLYARSVARKLEENKRAKSLQVSSSRHNTEPKKQVNFNKMIQRHSHVGSTLI